MWRVLLVLGIAGCATTKPPGTVPSTSQRSSGSSTRLLADFRAANQPSTHDGVPGPTVLSATEQQAWCDRLGARAAERFAAAERLGACAFRLVAPADAVPGVHVHFDATFFFRKPYAAASYDREQRVLYLPLLSLEQPWQDVPATRHEWRHAYLHAAALRGEPMAMALQTMFDAPEYAPDGLFVDEVPMSLCDWDDALLAGRAVEPWWSQMAEGYLSGASHEVEQPLTNTTPASRAGVPGVKLARGFLGGTDSKTSIALLREQLAASNTALAQLRAGRSIAPDYRKRYCAPSG